MLKEALLPSAIAKEIKQTIITRELKPGTKLYNEQELSAYYGVSRPTIREAMKILVAENVVEIRRGRGTFVTHNPGISSDPLGLEFSDQTLLIQNLFETRLLIEPPIAKLAALRRNDADLEQLAGQLKRFEEKKECRAHHAECDVIFHSSIARCSNNDVLYRILPIIIETIQKGSDYTYEIIASHKRASVFHHKLYHAIKEQDGCEAESLMRDHIMEAADDAKITLCTIT